MDLNGSYLFEGPNFFTSPLAPLAKKGPASPTAEKVVFKKEGLLPIADLQPSSDPYLLPTVSVADSPLSLFSVTKPMVTR